MKLKLPAFPMAFLTTALLASMVPVDSGLAKGPPVKPGSDMFANQWFFILESQAWVASDILIVNEGDEIDGKVTVEEVLYGSKTVGDVLEFPQLARFAAPEARTTTQPPDPSQKPEVIAGGRMLLCLVDVKPLRAPVGVAADSPPGVEHGVALIDEGRLYGARGTYVPAKLAVHGLQHTLERGREIIAEIIQARERIERCRKIDDSEKLAAEAAPLLGFNDYRAFVEGGRILTDSGAAAIPHLREYFKECEDPMRATELLSVIGRQMEVIRGRGGERDTLAPLFIGMADEYIAFWKRTAPTLRPNWWDGAGFEDEEGQEKLELLRMRITQSVEVVKALGRIGSEESLTKVIEIRDLWDSQPSLLKPGPNILRYTCASVLEEE